ncbi:hypothetical protein [Thermoflavimicrobium daqui]|jgi:hypothetical protein|uniref:Uncharacterized protein n=1 Tax=Thermoflavimicrobium daqui TaxID=2137476 RepID=A0A364K7G6_9BACL|nr:hypothetical protein [Thermoflavimicrobium daqui]RAL26239.1 hypothetical protein DL897_04375 [Thermoflavimicrobium daqui]
MKPYIYNIYFTRDDIKQPPIRYSTDQKEIEQVKQEFLGNHIDEDGKIEILKIDYLGQGKLGLYEEEYYEEIRGWHIDEENPIPMKFTEEGVFLPKDTCMVSLGSLMVDGYKDLTTEEQELIDSAMYALEKFFRLCEFADDEEPSNNTSL